MYWDAVLEEVINVGKSKNKLKKQAKSCQKSVTKKIYQLGEKFKDIHFSKREAECMVYLLKGKSLYGIAKILDLSPRTIEFYIHNMKQKLNCRTKFELIDLVLDSDFPANVDFAKL